MREKYSVKGLIIFCLAGLAGLGFSIRESFGAASLEQITLKGDPIPEIRPITEEQRRRLQYVLINGSPAGWK